MNKVILFIVANVLVVGTITLVSIYSIQPAMTEGIVFSGLDLFKAISSWIVFWASIEFHTYSRNYIKRKRA